MNDVRSILSSHHYKTKDDTEIEVPSKKDPTIAEIPDLFFDEILPAFKLNRIEICLLMILYREVWCRPNMYKKYGIGPIHKHVELAKSLEIKSDVLLQSLKNLESLGFIETIRSGQYFVRKFFTEENDRKYDQTYDNFL